MQKIAVNKKVWCKFLRPKNISEKNSTTNDAVAHVLKNINNNCLVVCDDYIHAEAIGVKKAVDESVREELYNFKVVANRFACLTKK